MKTMLILSEGRRPSYLITLQFKLHFLKFLVPHNITTLTTKLLTNEPLEYRFKPNPNHSDD